MKEEAIELIKRQMKDQGCEKDSLSAIALMQPHIYEWIMFFELNEGDLKYGK